jgi:2-polyprenyl-3-methyl-5-hydroxy-6-metoxy-1,4-benzoquinol methylase
MRGTHEQHAAVLAWATRMRRATPGYLEAYWDSWDAPYRQAIAAAILARAPASVLDVGCHAGAMLRLLQYADHAVALAGIDVLREAIRFARAHLQRWAWLEVGGLDDLRSRELQAEIVTTTYVLAYVPEAQLDGALRALYHAARTALVLAEPMTVGSSTDCAYLARRHDYVAACARLGWTASITPLDGPDALNALMVIERTV